MRTVLDTSVLIATGLPSLDGDLGVSVFSMAELHYGVLVAADRDVRGERLRRLTMLRELFEPIPVDDAVATSYGPPRLGGRRRRSESPSAEYGRPHRRDGPCARRPALHTQRGRPCRSRAGAGDRRRLTWSRPPCRRGFGGVATVLGRG